MLAVFVHRSLQASPACNLECAQGIAYPMQDFLLVPSPQLHFFFPHLFSGVSREVWSVSQLIKPSEAVKLTRLFREESWKRWWFGISDSPSSNLRGVTSMRRQVCASHWLSKCEAVLLLQKLHAVGCSVDVTEAKDTAIQAVQSYACLLGTKLYLVQVHGSWYTWFKCI